LALIARFGCKVHAFDPTPRSIEWLRGRELPSEFVFHPVGLAGYDGTAQFHPPANPAHVSHSMIGTGGSAGELVTVPVSRLSTLMRELGHDHVDVLKMDVEGAEYAALEDILGSGLSIGQILVEWHHRFPGIGEKRTWRAIRLLRKKGYRLFHISRNQEEHSFIRKGGTAS
jgi:FkbM family methyltransferase